LRSSGKLHKASAGPTLASGEESSQEITSAAFDICIENCDADVVIKADLKPLVAAGVKGFKCFLIESGVEVREH